MSTVLVNKKDELEIGDQRFIVLAHQPGIRVDVPDAFEINSRKTFDVLKELNDRSWKHISTGELFQVLFNELFGGEAEIPDTHQDLLDAGDDVQHGSGMIILLVEHALFPMLDGKPVKIFLRNPENFLHPKQERRVVSMIRLVMGQRSDYGTEPVIQIVDPEENPDHGDPTRLQDGAGPE